MGNRRTKTPSLIFNIITVSLLAACQFIPSSPHVGSPSPENLIDNVQPKSSLTLPTLNSATPLASNTPMPELFTLRIEQDLPQSFKVGMRLPESLFELTDNSKAAAELIFGNQNPVSQWIYALVAPFPTIIDNIKSSDLQNFWLHQNEAAFKRLIMDQSTYRAMVSLWDEPSSNVEVLPAENLLAEAWKGSDTWAIIPFEEIQPRWKVIILDEQSPIHKDFSAENYMLTVPISLVATEREFAGELAQSLKPFLLQTNREPDYLSTVILTGVTALVRATAWDMETKGITRPAEVIGATLREADVLHISNEVPFAENCEISEPPFSGSLIFCSKDSYTELLKVIGTDVVELTGDHFEDWGAAGMEHTLALYKKIGWPYYGGGTNIEEAKQPLKLEVNGTKIAFLGCNAKGSDFGNATETKPGNFRCDMDDLAKEVTKLKEEGYLPIVTFQHNEYYDWTAHYTLMNDFHRVEEAGAVIVSGSQAHQPHAIELTDEAVLHYGLGNLFFDQYGVYPDSDVAFLDRHVFYKNKYLGVELLTIHFEDYSQPLWMDKASREAMLEKLFSVSIWNLPFQ